MSDCRFGVSPVNYPDPDILSKIKKYPGKSVLARVNTDENTLLSDACLETLVIWQCGRVVQFDFLFK